MECILLNKTRHINISIDSHSTQHMSRKPVKTSCDCPEKRRNNPPALAPRLYLEQTLQLHLILRKNTPQLSQAINRTGTFDKMPEYDRPTAIHDPFFKYFTIVTIQDIKL